MTNKPTRRHGDGQRRLCAPKVGAGPIWFGDLYASFMDADRAERLGSQPISQTLAAARAVSSIPELLGSVALRDGLPVRPRAQLAGVAGGRGIRLITRSGRYPVA